ncbi:MAG: hypothetical protein OXC72_03430 [Roseovarius sp.]|nr:hypothetical protein [Roseovarius sp.]MCY4290797.1 hypothetical protein [Roseovarius sp.]
MVPGSIALSATVCTERQPWRAWISSTDIFDHDPTWGHPIVYMGICGKGRTCGAWALFGHLSKVLNLAIALFARHGRDCEWLPLN